MNNYEYSAAGLALTKESESCRLTAYRDGAGVWTIGWGHTGPEVHEGLVWTQAQADAQLLLDLRTAIKFVNAEARGATTQGEFNALVDFALNEGTGHLQRSTLLKLLNAGDVAGAAAQFAEWTKAGGKVEGGLVVRREREEEMFEGK